MTDRQDLPIDPTFEETKILDTRPITFMARVNAFLSGLSGKTPKPHTPRRPDSEGLYTVSDKTPLREKILRVKVQRACVQAQIPLPRPQLDHVGIIASFLHIPKSWHRTKPQSAPDGFGYKLLVQYRSDEGTEARRLWIIRSQTPLSLLTLERVVTNNAIELGPAGAWSYTYHTLLEAWKREG